MIKEEKTKVKIPKDQDSIPNFRKKLIHLRYLLGLSVEEFSRKIGITKDYLYRIENNFPVGNTAVYLKSPSKKIIDMIYDRLQIDKNLFEERVSFEDFERSIEGRELKLLDKAASIKRKNILNDFSNVGEEELQVEITNLNSMMSKDKEGMPLISPPIIHSEEMVELKNKIKTLEEKIAEIQEEKKLMQEERKQMMETIQTLAKQ